MKQEKRFQMMTRSLALLLAVVLITGCLGVPASAFELEPESKPKPEADETWLLLPGQYEYIAEAEGYERVDKTPFTVRTLVEGEKELKIDLSLTPIHVHKYAVTETHEPGCTEQGYTVYTCECGDSYTEYTDPIGSHLWQEAERIPATVEAEGSVFYICQHCGEEKTEALPKLDVMPVTVIPMLTPLPDPPKTARAA